MVLSAVAGLILVGLMVLAAIVVFSRNRQHPVDLEQMCRDSNFSCSALAGTLGPVLSLAFVTAVFLLGRLWLVRRPYAATARAKPHEVVPTAGKIIGEVVGRDELCNVILADVRNPETRRPHVIVGGVGTGKTALLVRLTQLLAERRAVPVVVRLREAQNGLEFRELARRRFIAEADRALGRPLSEDEGAKVWRQLLKDDQIVVLADGLEEALMDTAQSADRDNHIRLALHRAALDRLPLVVASRPHDPLRGMEATILELEPLSEEAALQYVQQSQEDDERRLSWIIETAEIVETPLYLQITRELNEKGLLKYVARGRDEGRLDTRGVDRAELRFRLLDAWTQALLGGELRSDVPLGKAERESTIAHLSLLACLGLKNDRLEVDLDHLEALTPRNGSAPRQRVRLVEELQQRRSEMRLAALWGRDLGLVEAQGNSVRFQHSIIQSYLGARLMDVAMADPAYRETALKEPGRELLIALVLHSRASGQRAGKERLASIRIRLPGLPPAERPLPHLLVEAAKNRHDVKALDLYAAAFQIDAVDERPAHFEIAGEVEKSWRTVTAQDVRTIEDGKLNLVHRYAESVRVITERRAKEPHLSVRPAYQQLFRIACSEPLHSVRLAVAQEIGADGDDAFEELAQLIGPPRVDQRRSIYTRWIPRAPAARHRTAGALKRGEGEREEDERRHRDYVMRAWLAPLLAGTVRDAGMGQAWANLEAWLDLVREQHGEPEAGHLSLEIALALGFKYAANRRRRHPRQGDEARALLAERTREMLRSTNFWFTRLILIQALCLWHLPDQPSQQGAAPARAPDYRALVRHWGMTATGTEHPFVAEARSLAVSALETGQPERFLWIDESGIVSRIGSRPADPSARRKHNLWIPPSTGWTALHPRAQQLVADVLLLLNLAERGTPRQRERRLQQTKKDFLPSCLAGDRSPLKHTRTTGNTAPSDPGSNCAPGCSFELCPYPPKGGRRYRNELSEAFCRRQQALVSRSSIPSRAAPWQRAPAADLRRFWRQMGEPV